MKNIVPKYFPINEYKLIESFSGIFNHKKVLDWKNDGTFLSVFKNNS